MGTPNWHNRYYIELHHGEGVFGKKNSKKYHWLFIIVIIYYLCNYLSFQSLKTSMCAWKYLYMISEFPPLSMTMTFPWH